MKIHSSLGGIGIELQIRPTNQRKSQFHVLALNDARALALALVGEPFSSEARTRIFPAWKLSGIRGSLHRVLTIPNPITDVPYIWKLSVFDAAALRKSLDAMLQGFPFPVPQQQPAAAPQSTATNPVPPPQTTKPTAYRDIDAEWSPSENRIKEKQ